MVNRRGFDQKFNGGLEMLKCCRSQDEKRNLKICHWVVKYKGGKLSDVIKLGDVIKSYFIDLLKIVTHKKSIFKR